MHTAIAALVALVLLFAAQAADAQPSKKIARIGLLATGSPTLTPVMAIREGLAELGWVEGRNIVIEYRFAEGKFDRLPVLAAELVRLNVDVIVAMPTPAALAAKNATATIPIVMSNVGDPVGVGLVASLARPAGNVTGTSFDVGLETFGKAFELLKETLPGIRTVAVLTNPGNPAQSLAIKNLKATAQSLGAQLVLTEARGPQDFDHIFARLARERVDALLVVPDSLFILHRERLADLVVKSRLPTVYGLRENVEAGGLMSYGPSLSHNARRAAIFVDRILKGAKPAEMPVEQPTKFELVINLRTASMLGITVPSSLQLRADEVIQ